MTFNIKTKTSGKCRVYPDSPNGYQPSVTSICGALMKYGLIQWSANCAVDYVETNSYRTIISDPHYGTEIIDPKVYAEARTAHEQIKDEAADFGTLAHELCQMWCEKKEYQHILDAIENGEIKAKAGQLLESFITWATKNKIEPVHTEIKLHGDGYSGRCDLIAYRTCPKTGVRRLGLYDIKTGKGSYYCEWGLQLSAYADAYDNLWQSHNQIETIDEIGIIKLNKDTLKCNFSEQSKPKFTADRDRLTKAWGHLVGFYWEYNNLKEQFENLSESS